MHPLVRNASTERLGGYFLHGQAAIITSLASDAKFFGHSLGMLLDFLYHHPDKLLVADLIRRTCQFERPQDGLL